jgi:translation initiation factor IF-1
MAKDDIIELVGMVEEVLPGNMFRVKVEGNQHIILCYMGGKLKQHKIKVILGDKVKMEISPYDLTRGRITYRM